MATSTQQAIIRIIGQYQSQNMQQGVVDINLLKRTLQDLDKQALASTKSITNSFATMALSIGSSMRMIGQSIQSTGMLMSLALTAPITAAGKEFGTKAAEWEQNMAAIATVSGKTKDSVTKDMDQILTASKNFTFGPKAMSDVVLSLTKAGFDLNTAMSLAQTGATYVTATFDGAKRTTENYAETTQTLASALRAYYGDDAAGKAIQTTNMLAAVMNKANADGTDFNSAFTYLFQSARLLNIPLQDVAIAIGVMSDKGVMGSRAGRELASAFITMSDDAPKVQEAFKSMGVSIFDADGKFKSLKTVVTDLNQAIFGTGQAQLVAAQGSVEATSSQVAAMKTAQDTLATFSGKQLENIQRIKDQVKAIQDKGKASKEELDAYNAAIAATQGSSTAVEAQTRALANNSAIWSKLSPQMRTWIGQLRDSAESANNNQAKYNKLASAQKKLITVNGKLSDVERIRLMQNITTQAGLRALEPLIEGGADAWNKYEKAIADSGTAEEQAKRKLDNLIDQIGLLRSNIEQTMIKALGPLIDKYIKPLVARINELVTQFDKLDNKWKEVIIIGMAFLAALGPILFAIGTMLFSAGMLVSGIGQVAKVFSALSILINPTTLLFITLGLAIAGVSFAIEGMAIAIIDNVNGIRDSLKSPWETIIGYFSDLKNWLDKKIPAAIDAMKGFFTNLGTELIKNIKFDAIFTEIDNLRNAFDKLFETIFGEPIETKTMPARGGIGESGRGKKQDKFDQSLGENVTKTTNKWAQQAAGFGGGIGKILADIANTTIPAFIRSLSDTTNALNENLPKWKSTVDAYIPILSSTFDDLSKSLDKLGITISGTDKIFSTFDMGKFINEEISKKMAMSALSMRMWSGAIDILTGSIKLLDDKLYEFITALMAVGKFFEEGDPLKGIITLNDILKKMTPFNPFKDAPNELEKQMSILDNIRAITGEKGILGLWSILKVSTDVVMQQMKDAIILKFQELFTALVGGSIVPDIVNGILLWWNTLLVNTGVVMSQISLAVTTELSLLQSKAEETFSAMLSKITTTISDMQTAVKEKFAEFVSLGENLVGSIVQGIGNKVTELIDGMVEAIKSAIAAAERAIAGWNPFNNNPSKPPTGKATGGSVYSGRQYLVGESGPELFVPRISGTIIPNHMIAGLASGAQSKSGNTTYSLQYQHIGGEPVAEREIKHILEMIELNASLNPTG